MTSMSEIGGVPDAVPVVGAKGLFGGCEESEDAKNDLKSKDESQDI